MGFPDDQLVRYDRRRRPPKLLMCFLNDLRHSVSCGKILRALWHSDRQSQPDSKSHNTKYLQFLQHPAMVSAGNNYARQRVKMHQLRKPKHSQTSSKPQCPRARRAPFGGPGQTAHASLPTTWFQNLVPQLGSTTWFHNLDGLVAAGIIGFRSALRQVAWTARR